MKVLEGITHHCRQHGVHFLVIGGHAINAHGYARQTSDLDLLVAKSDRDFWLKLMEALRYSAVQTHEVFARFKPPDLAAWPIDFMFVDMEVFKQMLQEAVPADFGSINAEVPSLRHMLALKLHALKQRQKHREQRDILDVIKLKELSGISEAEFLELCRNYDRLDLYEKISTGRC